MTILEEKGNKKSVEELYVAIFSIREALQDANQLAAEAAVIAEAFGGEISRVITNQLNQYFIPSIAKYIDDDNTPGAMGPLVTFLDSVPLAMTRQEPQPEQTTPAPVAANLAAPPGMADGAAQGSYAAQSAPVMESKKKVAEGYMTAAEERAKYGMTSAEMQIDMNSGQGAMVGHHTRAEARKELERLYKEEHDPLGESASRKKVAEATVEWDDVPKALQKKIASIETRIENDEYSAADKKAAKADIKKWLEPYTKTSRKHECGYGVYLTTGEGELKHKQLIYTVESKDEAESKVRDLSKWMSKENSATYSMEELKAPEAKRDVSKPGELPKVAEKAETCTVCWGKGYETDTHGDREKCGECGGTGTLKESKMSDIDYEVNQLRDEGFTDEEIATILEIDPSLLKESFKEAFGDTKRDQVDEDEVRGYYSVKRDLAKTADEFEIPISWVKDIVGLSETSKKN